MGKFFRNNFWKVGLAAVVLAILVLPVVSSAAEPTITDIFTGGWWGDSESGLLACDGEVCTDLCQLLDLINNLLFFGLTILLYVIAPIRFIIGGFLIMTGGTSEGLSRGKKMITGTAVGILIALGGFVIVATFLWLIGNNSAESGQPRVAWPEIACRAGAAPYPTSTPTGLGPGGIPGAPGTHADNLAQLQAAGIRVTTTGGDQFVRESCAGVVGPCTTLEGLPQAAIDGLIAIKNGCNCEVVVTAGTEPGHVTHGPGKPIVDIDDLPGVNQYIYGRIGNNNPTPFLPYVGSDGYRYMFENNHWHIVF